MRRLLFAGFAPLLAAAAVAQTPPVPPANTRPVEQLFPTHPTMKPDRIAPNPITSRPQTALPPQSLPPLQAQPLQAIPPGQGQTAVPTQPAQAGEPGRLPVSLTPEVTLPQKETLARIDPNNLSVRRANDRWVVTNGTSVVRDFGTSRDDAEEFVRVLRELRPTEWGSVGTSRVVVEYALTSGAAAVPSFSPKTSVTIDPQSLRTEVARGVTVVRDDQNILLNFGQAREDAEQAVAVIRKYRFNRIGQIGPAGSGVTFLFAQDLPATNKLPPSQNQLAGATAQLARAIDEAKLTRTGIEVDGGKGGAVGERIVIDSKAVELKRDKGDWKLMHGSDVLANFGASEWTGRDALKLVQDLRFTEFCRFNADITFFLVNGQAPTRVPFAAQATRFDREALKVKLASGGKYGLYEGQGRQLFVCDTEKEAEQLLKLIHQYGFDTTCQVGLGAKSSMRFLAKSGGR